jgi:predicted CoA-binding protein
MATLKEAAQDFLNQKHIAVAGVSRTDPNLPANGIYRKLRESGYQVYALNPNATEVEGDPCYPDLTAVPEQVDGVVIATHPNISLAIAQDCARNGVHNVWIHKSIDNGSLSPEAVAYCQEHKINLIPGGCPLMFCEPVDFGHKCLRWFLGMTGGIPKQV